MRCSSWDCSAAPDAEPSLTGADHHRILVREHYGVRILEAVSHLIKSPCISVAYHACLTVVSYCRGGNVCENCLVPIDKELTSSLVGSLLAALRSGPLSVDLTIPNSAAEGSLTVLVRAIGAVACLADASGEEFLPHCGALGGMTACAIFGLETSGQSSRWRLT